MSMEDVLVTTLIHMEHKKLFSMIKMSVNLGSQLERSTTEGNYLQ